MTAHFSPPQHVLDSMAARQRATAARRNRTCVYDACDQPVAHARGGSAARCQQHDLEDFGPTPTPDPARTLAGLRAAAGLRADAFTIGRTVLDQRAESSGRRVSSARRAAARGQVGGQST